MSVNARFIFLGPPGAGKGTQATLVSREMKIPSISTGAIFREAMANQTAMGKQISQFVNSGLLVPDKLTDAIVVERLQQSDCKNGFILDGYPRSIGQANALDEALRETNLSLGAVVYFQVEPSQVVDRMSQRRVCGECGRTYNLISQPTKKPGLCDTCPGKLITRSDDQPDAIRKRLETYDKTTKPLLDYYQQKKILKVLDASLSVEEVGKRTLAICQVA